QCGRSCSDSHRETVVIDTEGGRVDVSTTCGGAQSEEGARDAVEIGVEVLASHAHLYRHHIFLPDRPGHPLGGGFNDVAVVDHRCHTLDIVEPMGRPGRSEEVGQCVVNDSGQLAPYRSVPGSDCAGELDSCRDDIGGVPTMDRPERGHYRD